VSDEAIRRVKACTHPKIKGATKDLFEAIAELTLEGQNSTPFVAPEVLAAKARRDRTTVWRRTAVLKAIGVIRVYPGQDRTARYELVDVAGGGSVADAPLPLVGAAAPRRPRTKRQVIDATLTLFDEPVDNNEERAITRLQIATENPWRRRLQIATQLQVSRFLRWVRLQFATGSRVSPLQIATELQNATGNRVSPLQIATELQNATEPALPLGVPITDGLLLSTKKEEEVQTSTSSGLYVLKEQEPNQTGVPALLAWWLEEFPRQRDGARYTLKAWDPGKAAELLTGRPLAFVQRMCILAMTWPRGSPDPWLATCPDFGLSAVLHKATLLDEEVRRLEREEARLADIEAAAAVRADLAVKQEARRRDAEQAADVAYQRLTSEARAQLERDAREEFKAYRATMAPDAFERTVQQAVRRYLQDPRVRQMFELEQHEKYG
jgi:hypothetical protein